MLAGVLTTFQQLKGAKTVIRIHLTRGATGQLQ